MIALRPSTGPAMLSPSACFFRDPALLKAIPFLLRQYCGSSGESTGPISCSSSLKAAHPHLTGEEMKHEMPGPSFWNHRALGLGRTSGALSYFTDDKSGTWGSRGPHRQSCALSDWGGAPVPTTAQWAPCFLFCPVSPHSSLLPSLPAPLVSLLAF